MASNSQTGAQPLRPPLLGAAGVPQNFAPPMSMQQFRPAVSSQLSQHYMQGTSQQFRPLGQGVSVQAQQPQFSQPMQQLPPRPLQPGHGPPSSQSLPVSYIQTTRPISSGGPLTQQSNQSFSGHMSGVGMPMSSSYTYAPPSYGQPHTNVSAPTQYQPVSQLQGAGIPAVSQSWLLSGSQSSTPLVAPVVQTGQQLSPAATAASASSDWQEHTASDGRRYYYNKKTRQSSWEKPLELMTPIEDLLDGGSISFYCSICSSGCSLRADASTVWKEFTTPEGRKYYYNKVTKESKWTIPEELKIAREQADKTVVQVVHLEATSNAVPATAASPIETHVPTNAVANGTTSSSVQSAEGTSSPVLVTPVVTVNPPSMGASVPSDSVIPTSSMVPMGSTISDEPVAAPSSSVPAATSTSVAISASAMDVPSTTDKRVLDVSDSTNGVEGTTAEDLEEARRGMPVAGKINVTPVEEKIVDDEPFTYATKQEAKNAFKALLESLNVESDWTWEQAMRVIINDKRYGALKTLGERKQAFNEYLGQRKKQEAEERRMKQKKAREDFIKMLEESKELTSATRWSKAVTMFESDARFNAVERSRDREDLFESYLVELQKKERARAAEEHKRNIAEYRAFLESCDFIKANSQWRKVQDRLEDDERCSRLEKIDRLEIFQEYIRDLEKEEEEQKKIQKEQLRRAERKNRDEFRKLMEEHIASGELTAKTHWRDYCMKVKDLPAFLAVASNTSGSTPKDLFEDAAEELDKQYQEDKAQIKDALKIGKVFISSTWTFEDFKGAISQDDNFPIVSEINVKLVFNEYLERVKEKEEKEAKKRQRLADDFSDLLHSIKEINTSSTWEECKALFEESQEYRSIVEESFKKEIFDEYVAYLQEKAREKERKRDEEKAKKEKEKEEREKKKEERKEKERERDRGKGKERSRKDEIEGENIDVANSHGSKEERKREKDKDRKHRRRHHSAADDVSSGKDEEEEYKKSRRHTSDRKKSRKHGYTTDSDSESRRKRHKRDRDGSRRHEELEDGELGEDGEIH